MMWLFGRLQSQRYRLRYDGMIHILEIPKVRDYDSGHLRIVAKNPVGAVECSSSLSVVARDDWRSRLKQAPRCECFLRDGGGRSRKRSLVPTLPENELISK